MFAFLLQVIFWICCLLIVYSYILYPLYLFISNKFHKRPLPPAYSEPIDATVLIAAYNEEKVIKPRIENCLSLDYPPECLQVIIASDGSSDQTNAIVNEFTSQGVTLFEYQERRGKVNVLNDAIPKVKSEIIVFSDANTMFAKDAIKKLVGHFQDPKVGCVCGALRFVNAQGSNTANLEGVYWRYETFLKEMEGRRGSLLGANGGIFAIRKKLFVALPADTIVEDFVMPMKILENGYKVIFEPDAVAFEEAAKHIIQEKERRIRIGAGDFQALFMLLPMLRPSRGFSALAFWSHKVLRWYCPFFLIGAFVSNFLLLNYPYYPIYSILFFLQCCFYLSAYVGRALSFGNVEFKFFNLCYYFVSMNIALFLGFIRFVTGSQNVTWKRTER